MSDNKGKNVKKRYAAALKYKGDENEAPQVVALGKGITADKILKVAEENSVPVHEDPELSQALCGLEVGQEIPPELYKAVAEVLAFVMYLEDKASTTRR